MGTTWKVTVALALVAALAGCGSTADDASPRSNGSVSTIGSSTVQSTTSTTVPTTATASGSGSSSDSSTTTAPATGSVSTAATSTDTTSPDSTSPDTTGTDTTGPVTTPAPALAPAGPGDEGGAVVVLQDRLTTLGFDTGGADGTYGRRTTDAVRGFQLVVDLPATGQADAATIAALGTYRFTGTVLRAGDEGPGVAALQQRLADGPFDPGPIDGKYGPATVAAVWALSKLADVPVDSDWGPADEKALELLAAGAVGQPQVSHDRRWVEVDLSDQLMTVYDPGSSGPVLISHISSGNGQAWSNENHSGTSVTPRGSFEIYRRISGWRESSLDIGRLYNPLYFTGGIALHGAASVPLYPASHGCVRVPMHIADYLPAELPDGTPVDVLA